MVAYLCLALAMAGAATFLERMVQGLQANPASLPTATVSAPWPQLLFSLPTGVYLLVIALGALALGARFYLGGQMALREESALRSRLTGAYLHSAQVPQAGGRRSGDLVAMLADGTERVSLYRQTFLAPMYGALGVPALILVLMALFVDPLAVGVLAVCVPIVPISLALFLKFFRSSGGGTRKTRARLAAQYLDAIQGLTTLRLHRAAQRMEARLAGVGEENRRAIMRLLAGNQVVILLMDTVFSLFMVAAAAVTVAGQMYSGHITLAAGLTVIMWTMLLLEPIDHVGMFFYIAMGGLGAQRGIRAFLARHEGRPPATPSTPAKVRPVHPAPAPAGDKPAGEGQIEVRLEEGPAIELQDVSFAYPGGEPVIAHQDLVVARGERLAIIGPSGQGKSTLIALLKGELRPSSGRIILRLDPAAGDRVAGNRAAFEAAENSGAGSVSVPPASQVSALVAQSTYLFTGTVADNLRLGDPQASDSRLWQALEAVNLAAEVRQMPAGLNTEIGERAAAISGGQAQRISLARAFLADRPFLLLDEATSQVDLYSEQIILQAIGRLAQGRTVVMVTHRPSALEGVERVLQLEGGAFSLREVPAHD